MQVTHMIPEFFFPVNHRQQVHVIGSGATGSRVVKALADIDAVAYHTGMPGLSINIWDPKEVREHNVGKQLFYPSDIGKNKAEVIAETVRMSYWMFDPQVKGIPNYFTEDTTRSKLSSMSLIIICTDSRKSRRDIYDALGSGVGTYYVIDSGNGRDFGQVYIGCSKEVSQPEDTDNFKFVKDLPLPYVLDKNLISRKKEDVTETCSAYESLKKQSLFINQFLGVVIGNMILSIIDTRMIFYDAVFVNLQTMMMNARALTKL